MRVQQLFLNSLLTFFAILFSLIAVEIGLRAVSGITNAPVRPVNSVKLHIPTEKAYLYGLNPEHPLISSQGLRNRLVELPKPEGRFRILVLGDSVTFGPLVNSQLTTLCGKISPAA